MKLDIKSIVYNLIAISLFISTIVVVIVWASTVLKRLNLWNEQLGDASPGGATLALIVIILLFLIGVAIVANIVDPWIVKAIYKRFGVAVKEKPEPESPEPSDWR